MSEFASVELLIASVVACGSRCLTIEQLCPLGGLGPYDGLSIEEKQKIDLAIFTCDGCGWTMPVAGRATGEAADGFLCKQCAGEDVTEC